MRLVGQFGGQGVAPGHPWPPRHLCYLHDESFGQILASFLGVIRVPSTERFDPNLKSQRAHNRSLSAAVCLRNLPEFLTLE